MLIIFLFLCLVSCAAVARALWAVGPKWIVLAGTNWHLNTTRLEMMVGMGKINNIAA